MPIRKRLTQDAEQRRVNDDIDLNVILVYRANRRKPKNQSAVNKRWADLDAICKKYDLQTGQEFARRVHKVVPMWIR